jgi:D-alanyl-D-alanine carboxypeptidase (penicillin-binding protein 5/6)
MTIVLDIQAGPGVASAQQTGAREVDEPEVAARAWALAGLRSGEYLAGEGASRELPTASITKIRAALVVLEKADLDEEVMVSEDAAAYATPVYSNVGLLTGDPLSVRELLIATLISSGDDAAYVLAEHVGGEAGVNRFVEEMNERARASGLKHAHFENPVGFDARGHYSSARDLARMARLAIQDLEFREDSLHGVRDHLHPRRRRRPLRGLHKGSEIRFRRPRPQRPRGRGQEVS